MSHPRSIQTKYLILIINVLTSSVKWHRLNQNKATTWYYLNLRSMNFYVNNCWKWRVTNYNLPHSILYLDWFRSIQALDLSFFESLIICYTYDYIFVFIDDGLLITFSPITYFIMSHQYLFPFSKINHWNKSFVITVSPKTNAIRKHKLETNTNIVVG